MVGEGCRNRGFTLIEIVVVVAILAVITTAASVTLGRMFGLWRGVRTAALVDQNTRDVLLDLSGELRSSSTVTCRPGTVQMESEKLSADTLVYKLDEQVGEPSEPARLCTVRLVQSTDTDAAAGLIKEVRSDSGTGDRVVLIPEAVGFQVHCLTRAGWTSQAMSDVWAVALTVWVKSSEGGRGPRVYSTAVNVPRALWQRGVQRQEE